MPIFEFDEGTRSFVNDTEAATISFVDDGVTFSFSVTSADGRTSIQHQPSASFGLVRDYLEGKEVSGGTDEFTLSADNKHFDGTEDDPVRINLNKVDGKVTVKFKFFDSTETSTQTLNSAGSLSAIGEFDEIVFTTTGEFQIDSLEAQINVNCFLEGTYLTTPTGEVAVEELRQGDELRLASGGKTRISWIARQTMYPRFQQPQRINPVCIKAGALADGVPARDLYLTADHAVVIDGLLINAAALINGQSIFQVQRMPVEGFTYYHVETDAHQVILSENTPSETFVDYAGRWAFDNVSEHPDPSRVIAEMEMPRVATKRLVPAYLSKRIVARSDALAVSKAC
ncbi:MAG: Hint domain-containing protein [Pseudomonadota bacterium]